MSAWRGIDEFLAVVGAGSFTAAAEQLGVSKSFISKLVNELEERVGTQLIVRTTRRLSLTAAGEVFYERCRAMRDDLTSVERTMAQFQSRPMGRLRIGLSDTFGSDFMSALLADFSAMHPDIAIEAIAYLRESELIAETFDIIVRYGQLDNSSQRARLFGYLSYCLCASPEYVAEHGWPKSITDLSNHSCLTDQTGQYHFNDDVQVRVSGKWTSNSGVALRWAARRGLGLAHLPISVIRTDLVEGRIIAMKDDWTFHDKEVRAVFPPGILPAATRAFIDYLTSHFTRTRIRPSMVARLSPGEKSTPPSPQETASD
ncbi:MAG: LysR substrate-binding domain-containing protein [Sphingomonadales bacterium]